MPCKTNTPNPAPLEKENFEQWFKRQDFKHFSADEFLGYFNVTRRGVRNSIPPKSKWHNIVPTLRIVDSLRAELGRPIVILSSYRSPRYNAAINGAAKKSQHTEFRALDIAVIGYTPKQVYNALLNKRNLKQFIGGLGLYNTFVHIDTRNYNATF